MRKPDKPLKVISRRVECFGPLGQHVEGYFEILVDETWLQRQMYTAATSKGARSKHGAVVVVFQKAPKQYASLFIEKAGQV